MKSAIRNPQLKNRKQKGFTMIEALVGLGIFFSISMIVMQVFGTAQSLARFHALDQQIQNDLRAALESAALDIRSGFVDYAKYTGGVVPTGPVSNLFYKTEDNTAVEVTSSDKTTNCTGAGGSSCCADAASAPCLVKVVYDPTDPTTARIAAITGRNIKIVGNFPAFHIFPKTDPASGGLPRTVVTVVLRAEQINISGTAGARPFYLQTTATPRNQPLPQ